MRILQIAPYLPPYIGGQEKYVYYLSRELVQQGHEVTAITTNYPKTNCSERVEGIEILRYQCYGRPLRNPITPRLMFPSINVKQFDLIHCHNEHSLASFAAIFHKIKTKIPVVITCHGKLVFDSAIADSIRTLYWHIIGRLILRKVDQIVVATPSEKQRIIKESRLSDSKINVVPVGIDIGYWDTFLYGEKQRLNELHRNYREKIILVATQLIRRKGIHYLIQAMPDIVKVYPDILCVIAGGGDFEKALKRYVTQLGLDSHVKFVGVLSGAKLADAYKSADVFVLPSLGEGQPTCIMEAMAFSIPVIASRIEGVIDYFQNETILVEPQNSKELAEAIIGIFDDKKRATALGMMGRKLVESKFTWGRIANQILDVYERVISD